MAGDAANNEGGLDGKVEFIQYHKPTLKAGRYEIEVTQAISTNEASNKKIPLEKYPVTRSFVILGERFDLKPEEILSVFPPDGSLGDHSNVLPHIILNRSTLPWERASGYSNSDAPWLALLLFDQGEAPDPKVKTLGELKNPAAEGARFPTFTLEDGQSDTDKVTVIDVKKRLLQAIVPAGKELELLAHVRQTKDSAGKKTGDETAVVIGNRLPRSGALSTVHLVSIEGRYKGADFDYQGARDDDAIRLVSLKSWTFACADHRQSFKGLLTNLNRTPGTLRLPANGSPDAEKFLSKGFIPLQHHLRQGEKTISFYHGPLITGYHSPLIGTGGQSRPEVALPARAADELLRYDSSYGLLDVSYAAAWELGRMLALQSKRVSIGLYNWKRAHARHLAQDEQRLIHSHLPMYEQASEAEAIPAEIASWFEDLNLLRGAPFNYLVPDERMLPRESIRFFWLDETWIDCLLDGAFSVGRVPRFESRQDQADSIGPQADSLERLTGFLLRSDVVSGWPGLLIDAYGADAKKLDLLRRDQLSDNVMICLYQGEISRVEFHQKPESLHFGLDINTGNQPGYYKKLRDSQGREGALSVSSIPWRVESQRVINIFDLAGEIRRALNLPPLNSAQFALQMIEGVDKVVLQKPPA